METVQWGTKISFLKQNKKGSIMSVLLKNSQSQGDPFSKEGGLNQEIPSGLDIKVNNEIEKEIEKTLEKESVESNLSAVDMIRNMIFFVNKGEIERKERLAKQVEILRKKKEQRERNINGRGPCLC